MIKYEGSADTWREHARYLALKEIMRSGFAPREDQALERAVDALLQGSELLAGEIWPGNACSTFGDRLRELRTERADLFGAARKKEEEKQSAKAEKRTLQGIPYEICTPEQLLDDANARAALERQRAEVDAPIGSTSRLERANGAPKIKM